MPYAKAASLSGHGLGKDYGMGEARTVALNDVDVELSAGRMTLLMGPSGSGKSTLLAILSGLLRPDRGRVVALGRDLWTGTERNREAFRREHCGFVFQGYNLFPALTARQQLEVVLRWGQGASRVNARRRALELLDHLGLARKARLRPAQLSGGEKQRVAVGRALVKQPTFCFADEPTAALDWEHGHQVVQLLRQAAHESNTTVLIVSHDPRVAAEADQVIYLEDGCICQRPSAAGLTTINSRAGAVLPIPAEVADTKI